MVLSGGGTGTGQALRREYNFTEEIYFTDKIIIYGQRLPDEERNRLLKHILGEDSGYISASSLKLGDYTCISVIRIENLNRKQIFDFDPPRSTLFKIKDLVGIVESSEEEKIAKSKPDLSHS